MAQQSTYTGLLSQGQSFSPSAMPGVSSMPDAPTFESEGATVNVSSPEQRKYSGFDLDSSYGEKATGFTPSSGSSVEDRLSGLLSSSSDYLKRAEGKAKTYANRRGLLNSSMAAGAGAAAAIDAALPIAQQDAAATVAFDQQRLGYLSDSALSEQQAYNSSRQSAQDYTQRSGELVQQFEGQVGLNNQQADQQSILSAQNATQNAGLSRQQGQISQILNRDNARFESALSSQNAGQESSLQAQGANEGLRAAEQAFIQQLGLNVQNFDFQRALNDQQYRIQLGISQQDFVEALAAAQQAFGFESQLSGQQFAQQSQLSSQENQQAMQRAEQAFVQQLGLNVQNFDFQRALSDQDYRQQLGISDKDFNEAVAIANQAFNQESALSAQQFGQQSQLSTQENLQAMQRAEQAFVQQLGINQQGFDFQKALSDQDYRQQLGISDKDFQEALAASQQAFAQQSQLQSQANSEAMQRAEQSFIQQLGLNEQGFDFQRILSDQNYREQLGISEKDFREATAIANQEFTQSMQQAQQQFEFQSHLQTMDQGSRERLLNIQQQYGMLLQQSQATNNRFQFIAAEISEISQNSQLSAVAKQAAIDNVLYNADRELHGQAALLAAAGIQGVSPSNMHFVSGGSGIAPDSGQSIPQEGQPPAEAPPAQNPAGQPPAEQPVQQPPPQQQPAQAPFRMNQNHVAQLDSFISERNRMVDYHRSEAAKYRMNEANAKRQASNPRASGMEEQAAKWARYAENHERAMAHEQRGLDIVNGGRANIQSDAEFQQLLQQANSHLSSWGG